MHATNLLPVLCAGEPMAIPRDGNNDLAVTPRTTAILLQSPSLSYKNNSPVSLTSIHPSTPRFTSINVNVIYFLMAVLY